MICTQVKIKCKIILLKTLENGLNKSYFMTYQWWFECYIQTCLKREHWIDTGMTSTLTSNKFKFIILPFDSIVLNLYIP